MKIITPFQMHIYYIVMGVFLLYSLYVKSENNRNQETQGLDFASYKYHDTWYNCYVDSCNWRKYCDHISQRCEDCSIKFKDCYSPEQEPNCTVFCMTYQPCSSLKPLPHGNHNGTDRDQYMYGIKVTFTCDPGYQNLGVRETTCQYFGKWSHLQLNISHPICKENRCIIPHQPAHGRVNFSPDITELVVGSEIFYSCEAGYQIQGKDSNRTCLTDGTWSGTMPDCVETSTNPWMIAAGAGCLSLLLAMIYLCQKLCRERKKYEKVPKSKVLEKKLETEEEPSQTTLLHKDDVIIDTKSNELQDVQSLSKRTKKAVPPSCHTGQVVNQFFNSKVSYGNNNAILENHKEETRSIDPKESNDPVVTTCAFKETGIDSVMTSFDLDKNVECEDETAIEIAGDTDHLIAEETEPAFP